MRLSIVVPIFNEQLLIQELYTRLTAVLAEIGQSYEIIFVDDGSSDGSLQLLTKIQSEDERVGVIEFTRNFGQTAALAAGIDFAHGEVIITMDGDLQHEPEVIPHFLEKLDQGFDLVSGCRQKRSDNVFARQIPSWIANRLMRFLSGVNVKDFGSTYKAYRSSMLKQLELFGELHRFIPVLADRIGGRITEIPIVVAARKSGQSNYGLRRVFGVLEDLVFLEFYANYLTKPIRAFGKLFFLFFGIGFSISFSLMLLWFVGQISAVWEHSAALMLSVFLMIIGVQFLVVGILAELLTRIYHHTSDTKIYTVRATFLSSHRDDL